VKKLLSDERDARDAAATASSDLYASLKAELNLARTEAAEAQKLAAEASTRADAADVLAAISTAALSAERLQRMGSQPPVSGQQEEAAVTLTPRAKETARVLTSLSVSTADYAAGGGERSPDSKKRRISNN
jgi:hypothetical protein